MSDALADARRELATPPVGLDVDTGVRQPPTAPIQASDELRPNFCLLCARQLPPPVGRRGKRRLYHPACGAFVWYLKVAEKALGLVEFASDAQSSAVRSRLVKMANALPVPRDGRGRFVAGGVEFTGG